MASENKPSEIATTAPISAYDHFTPELIKKIERSIKGELGARSEATILEHGAPISIFKHTDQGLICNNCGALQTSSAPESCPECGASHVLTLIIGVR